MLQLSFVLFCFNLSFVLLIFKKSILEILINKMIFRWQNLCLNYNIISFYKTFYSKQASLVQPILNPEPKHCSVIIFFCLFKLNKMILDIY